MMSSLISGLIALLSLAVFPFLLFTFVVHEKIDQHWDGIKAALIIFLCIIACYLSITLNWSEAKGMHVYFRFLKIPCILSALFISIWIIGVFDRYLTETHQRNISIYAAFILGVLLSVISLPCVGPILGGMLQEGPNNKYWFYLLELFGFAIGLGLPIIIILLLLSSAYHKFREKLAWKVIRISSGIFYTLYLIVYFSGI